MIDKLPDLMDMESLSEVSPEQYDKVVLGDLVDFFDSIGEVIRNSEFIQTYNAINAKFVEKLPRLKAVFDEVMNEFMPFFVMLSIAVKNEQHAERLQKMGFVPHPLLLSHCLDYSSSDETDIKSFLEEAWKELQQQLKIQGGDLLGDERLCCMYRQMLDSHENGAYEAVFAMYPPFLERCANLAAANVDHTVTNKIIAGLMKSMPVEVFGWEGYRCFEVIEKQTKRGELLDDHPLFLVGVDYNKAALKVTRANLILTQPTILAVCHTILAALWIHQWEASWDRHDR